MIMAEAELLSFTKCDPKGTTPFFFFHWDKKFHPSPQRGTECWISSWLENCFVWLMARACKPCFPCGFLAGTVLPLNPAVLQRSWQGQCCCRKQRGKGEILQDISL